MVNRFRLAAFIVTALAASAIFVVGFFFREEVGEVMFNAAML